MNTFMDSEQTGKPNWDGYVSPTKVPQYLQKIGVTETSGSGSSGGSGTSSGGSSSLDSYMAMLSQLQAQKDAAVNAAYEQGKKNLKSAKNSGLKSSYVAYMQGLKNIPQISAASGNGGEAQSNITKQQLAYENGRADIEKSYLDNLQTLERNRANGLISNNEDYVSAFGTIAQQQAAANTAAAKSVASAASASVPTYKTGAGNTMDINALLNQLMGSGMTREQAAAWMKANGLVS